MNKKLMVVTDTWKPYFNGVITTLKQTITSIQAYHDLDTVVVHPRMAVVNFKYFSLKELDVVHSGFKQLEDLVEVYRPAYIHIETEGPLGIAMRNLCIRRGWKFTTAYHTKHPEYLKLRYGIPLSVGYAVVRWFHKPSSCVMAPTDEVVYNLKEHGFKNKMITWTRGVDTNYFTPEYRKDDILADLKPYALNVVRVAKEKNIEEFLEAKTDLKKVIVGDGPARPELEKKYPNAVFLGKQFGYDLARIYANAEVFVFPSVEDTFGVVLLEALASGVPVAAKPESLAVVTPEVACLLNDMSDAIQGACLKSRKACREFVLKNYTPEIAAKQFYNNLILK